MPELTLAQHIEGGVPGDVVTVEDEGKAAFYVSHGYAYNPADESSNLLNTSVPRDQDPTLAQNRESPYPVPTPDVTPPTGVGGSDQVPDPQEEEPEPEPDPEPAGGDGELEGQAARVTTTKKVSTKK